MNRVHEVAEAIRDTLARAQTSAGDRVYLARLRPMTDDGRPRPDPRSAQTWINVAPLEAEPVGGDGQQLMSHIDWHASFGVDLYIKSTEAKWYEAAMGLWASVHHALTRDYTMGLPYVIDATALGAQDPEPEIGDQVFVALRTVWRIHLRTSPTDLEN